ncbi:PaaI family thioesterase [Nocardia jejuensis]|uniref:PaaI family thioesterase n=1 Tax=Nocardia jejuensis TaxID=328049 RepID=UPI000A05ABE2|nr:PaaI family thioesterase [Nocardia jejuensis]
MTSTDARPETELEERAALEQTVLEEGVLEEAVLEEGVLEEAVLEEGVLDEAVLDETVLDETVAKRVNELTAVFERGLQENLGVGASLGIRLVSAGDGCTKYYLDPNPATINAMFTVHGGVIATLMDTAMGSAVFTKLPDGVAYTTLEFKVNFIRAVTMDGSRLTCDATAVHVGRRTATAEGRITDAAGKLIAHGSTTVLVLGPGN